MGLLKIVNWLTFSHLLFAIYLTRISFVSVLERRRRRELIYGMEASRKFGLQVTNNATNCCRLICLNWPISGRRCSSGGWWRIHCGYLDRKWRIVYTSEITWAKTNILQLAGSGEALEDFCVAEEEAVPRIVVVDAESSLFGSLLLNGSHFAHLLWQHYCFVMDRRLALRKGVNLISCYLIRFLWA